MCFFFLLGEIEVKINLNYFSIILNFLQSVTFHVCFSPWPPSLSKSDICSDCSTWFEVSGSEIGVDELVEPMLIS